MKKTILVVLLVLSLLAVSCNNTNAPSGPTFDPYVGGQKGVVMSFIEGMPPMEEGTILDGGNSWFSVGVELENTGEHDIEEGDFFELYLTGILPELFDKTNADMVLPLEDPLLGTKKLPGGVINPGQSTTLTFEDLSYQPNLQGNAPQSFTVEMCYDYETRSTTQICIANDVTGAITDQKDKDVCNVNEAKTTKNSAAPVQITNFKQMPRGGDKIGLSFDIQHIGNGDVFRSTTSSTANPEKCDYSQANPNKGVVELKLILPEESSATVECQGGKFTSTGNEAFGEIKLFNTDMQTVTCSIEGNVDEGIIYESFLNIELYYMYGEIMKTTSIITDYGQ